MSRLRHAAVVAERVARIDELVAGVRAEYQALQTERFALVGAYTPAAPAGAEAPGPPQPARRSRTPSASSSGSSGAPPSPDRGGTSHGTSNTTTSSYFARIRGDPGAGTGGDTTPPLLPMARTMRVSGPWVLARLARAPLVATGLVGQPSAIRTRSLAAGRGPTPLAVRSVAADRGSRSPHPMLSAHVAVDRGFSLTRRRPLVILPPR